MSAKVLTLPGVTPADEPVDCVISTIEELLAEARTGKIRSILYVTVDGNRNVTPGISTSGEHAHEFVSGAVRLLDIAKKHAFGDL